MSASRLNSDLRRFLQGSVNGSQAREMILRRLRQRERSFLWLMRRAVYARAGNPYRTLLQHVGITLGDLKQWVAGEGLETALSRLLAAGVYVTPEEFKGRRSIRRSGLELHVEASDFDNPLVAGHFDAQTSGSHGPATPVAIDLRPLAYEAAHLHHFLEGFGLRHRPVAAWRGVPPVASGVRMLLRYAKLGLPVERWFAQNRLPERPDTITSIEFTRDLLDAAKRLGWPLPEPEYVHQDDAAAIAHWLAEKRAARTPAQLDTNASSAVRVCLAALDGDIDISGTFFRVGGEPYTPMKGAIIHQAGCQAATHYSTTELSHIGIACAAPEHLDEVHLLTEKFAFLQSGTSEAASADTIRGTAETDTGGLLITTLLPTTSKIMLNVDSGDFGALHHRACGCPLGNLGLDLHMSHLRSYENVTSEGLSYLRGDLTRLIEFVLPKRFGGTVGDYQLVEAEVRGIPIVEIVVSPQVGPIEEAAVPAAVYEWLRAQPGEPLMADFWQDANTVRVVRRVPHATSSAKVLPLRRLVSPGGGH